MLEKLLPFGLGFVTGALYASYRYEHNPNELFEMAKEDISHTTKEVKKSGEKVAKKVEKKIDDIKKSSNKNNQEVEVVSEGEVI